MAVTAERRMLYAAITRIDRTRREVTLVATSEAVDSFGTRFSFEASLQAFERAWGNVREMHANKAVGRIVAWTADAAKRLITVVVRISRGSEDTWQKIVDGTLRGASIGASNVQWERGADGIPIAINYDLVELSLVDNPSNPDCQVLVVRMGEGARRPHPAKAGYAAAPQSRALLPAAQPHPLAPSPFFQKMERGNTTISQRGEGVMARRNGPGAVPANSVSGDLGNAADAVNAVQPHSVGKLVLATSTNPGASDYGVPPTVSVAATPFADGHGGRLGSTATSGAFHEGGHPQMPGESDLDQMDFGDLNPMWDTDELHPSLQAQAPTPLVMPTLGGKGATARQGRAAGVSPEWHSVRDSAIDHATGVMDSCGCEHCATLAQVIRDALGNGRTPDPESGAPLAGLASLSGRTLPPSSRMERGDGRRVVVGDEQRAFQQQVSGAFAQLSGVLAALTERVEIIGAQPLPGGPVAMATRGFTQLPVEQQITTLQRFASRSGDPNVQAEAAAAILSLQQG